MSQVADLSSLFVGFVLGVFVTVTIQTYIAWRYLFSETSSSCMKNEKEDNNDLSAASLLASTTAGSASFRLPLELSTTIGALLDGRCPRPVDDANSCLVNNLIMQFLFRELRDTARVHRWFMQKLSVEFEELLQRTTIGKLLEKITVRELHLGYQFPFFKSLSVDNIRLHEAGHIEELDVLVDVDYEGGFQLAVDADLVLGRTAFVSVRVTRMNGRARLRFSRSPHTHWSFAFCAEPHLDVHVESNFQGRQLPHFTSIIVNQIKRLVRKKHTLPNYKIRYRPFFHMPECSIDDVDVYLLGKNRISEGLLYVTVVECSRLSADDEFLSAGDVRVYCTLAIDSSAYVDYIPSKNSEWVTRDLPVIRSPGQAIGVTFKQEFVINRNELCVIVDSVTANSPAVVAGVRSGDIVTAINGSKVNSAAQAARLCKANVETTTATKHSAASINKLMIRIANRDNFRSILVDGDVKQMSAEKVDVSNVAVDDGAPASSSSSPQRNKSPLPEISTCTNNVGDSSITLKRTSALKFVRDPVFRESFTFDLDKRHRFLILCVWRRVYDNQKLYLDRGCSGGGAMPSAAAAPASSSSVPSGGLGVTGSTSTPTTDVLIGRVSVSLLDVAMECAANSRGLHRHTFQLSPPELKAVAHSRTSKPAAVLHGFDKNLCYGDVTLSFIHKPGVATSRVAPVIGTRVDDGGSGEESIDAVGNIPAESSDVDEDSFAVLNDSTASNELSERLEHDFIITQFNSTISCHFCGKKIWFKIAFKCQCCALICHKKCVGKCRVATTCCRNGVRLKPVSAAVPRITKTDASRSDSASPDVMFGRDDVDRDASVLESPKTQRRLRSLLSTIVSASCDDGAGGGGSSMTESPSARRASAADSIIVRTGCNNDSLVPPPSEREERCSPSATSAAAVVSPVMTVQSRSLPPTPQTSPSTSRKASLQGNLLNVSGGGGGSSSSVVASGCGDLVDPSDDIAVTIERLLQYANDETIVSVAKEKGRELFAGEDLDERKAKLDSMVSRLQVEIDQETERRNLLATIERESMGLRGVRGLRARHERTRLAMLLTKSDEKIQALSILMLFYCSGLQNCYEMEGSSTTVAAATANAEDDSSSSLTEEISDAPPPI